GPRTLDLATSNQRPSTVVMKTILLAVGGNSLIRAGEKGTAAEQLANARRTAAEIVALIRQGYHLVITHGNGPQVGAALLRSERAVNLVPSQPLDVCGACSQGEIGYLLEQSLINELHAAGLDTPVISMMTQSIVSPDDPAMQRPSKPIGPFYSRLEAEERKKSLGWQIVEDASRGYRRVVPSPEPTEIVELEVIRDLVGHGVLVVACGGGGIPVIRRGGELAGVEAVIDKDRASALLAAELKADLFVISTDTDFVYLDYKKPTQRALTTVAVDELETCLAAGQFPPGNMGPKIESVLRFLRAGGKEAIITSYEYLTKAVSGTAGTHILPTSMEMPNIPVRSEAPVGGR
ncbi:MAG TPA: carbamate kinase, partial [Terriglobales bacterium]|nr:carbamate kinase [Terriglobales bacterium]